MVTHKTAIKLSHGTDNQYIVFKKKNTSLTLTLHALIESTTIHEP